MANYTKTTIGKENRIELHEKLSLTGAEISLNELPAGANVPFVHSHKENAPGWSLEALEYIYKVRNAAANGHETLDTDSSAVAEEKGDLACERYVLDNDKLQVEVLANLDKVQPAGAVVIVSYPRIEGATGLPARVWAITE